MIAFLAFAFPLALYLSVPSTFWNFDGVACAAALELGQPTFFFHANHLIYGFLGFAFWKWIGLPLGLSRALPALQLFTSLTAALGLAGLYKLLEHIIENRLNALILTSTLAATAAFWVWSIEAQVYSLGFAALAWAACVLVQSEGSRKYIVVGLLHGAAVLGHLMHFLWAVPALYWMWGNPKAIRQYLASLVLITAIPYLLVLGLVIAPGRDWTRILIWLKGSAGLTPDRHWAWHSSGWGGPWIWLRSTAPALWGSFWPYGKTTVTPGIWALTGASIAAVAALLVCAGFHRSEKTARFSVLWLGSYGLFLSTWEPATLCYRMPDIIPLGILLAIGLKVLKPALRLLVVTLFLGSTLYVNFFSRIGPMHHPEQNPAYQETLMLSRMTPFNSLYVTQGGTLWIYLLYFTGRTAWNANTFEPARLAEEIGRQKRERPVYILEGVSWRKVL